MYLQKYIYLQLEDQHNKHMNGLLEFKCFSQKNKELDKS